MELSKSNTAYSPVLSSNFCLTFLNVMFDLNSWNKKSHTGQQYIHFGCLFSQGNYRPGTEFSHHISSLTTSKPCNLRRLMPVTLFQKNLFLSFLGAYSYSLPLQLPIQKSFLSTLVSTSVSSLVNLST